MALSQTSGQLVIIGGVGQGDCKILQFDVPGHKAELSS